MKKSDSDDIVIKETYDILQKELQGKKFNVVMAALLGIIIDGFMENKVEKTIFIRTLDTLWNAHEQMREIEFRKEENGK